MMPPLENPKYANLWIFGGVALAALSILSPSEWYAHLGFLWNIYHANIEGTVIPVRAALAVASLSIVWGCYLRTKISN
jgi:hypothetical protein